MEGSSADYRLYNILVQGHSSAVEKDKFLHFCGLPIPIFSCSSSEGCLSYIQNEFLLKQLFPCSVTRCGGKVSISIVFIAFF